MANIRVTCPACKSELEIDAAFDGQEVECGNCLEVFTAKGPGGSAGGKIPGAGKSSPSASGSGRGKPEGRPPRKTRRDEEDDDYDHDRDRKRRRDDDDDDDDYAPPPPRRRGANPGDNVAVASLILGIIAIVPGCCCGLISVPCSIAAIATGCIGLKSEKNNGLAVTGIVLGGIGLCIFGGLFFAGMGNALFNPQQFR